MLFRSITLGNLSWSMVILFVLCFVLLRKTRLNPVLVMVLAGVLKLIGASAAQIGG